MALQHWSVALQRYAARVVKTYPRNDEYSIQSANNTLDYIKNQLEFIKTTISPFFSIKNAAANDSNKVSKEKLVDLWLNRRKKAIAVIRNNGCWPATVTARSTVSQNENYFQSSPKCAIRSDFIPSGNHYFDRALARSLVNQSNLFDVEEITDIVRQCPRGKSCGIDGVYYEDLRNCNRDEEIVNIMNVCLVNQRVSAFWKHCVISRIPKKNFNPDDLSTLRDISLLPVSYKVFSKALCNRLLPFVSDKVAFWQRAFLSKRDRQDLIFTLKTAFDDFRHKSSKMVSVFIDFADAFGSVEHEFIFETLESFDIPLIYCALIEDIYRYSSFAVICGCELSELFYIIRGTKTGDPLSALIFILVIDVVCRPMYRRALDEMNILNDEIINPLPVQAFADDINTTHHDAKLIQKMFDVSEEVSIQSGLEVKPEKCAVLYARRSGNSWYKGKNDVTPVITVQGNVLETHDRNYSYKYLGKSLSLSGEDSAQVEEFIKTYLDLVKKISDSSLPLALKASALNNMALAKILHHFYNTRLSEEQLEDIDKSVTKTVREMYALYTTTTNLVIYLPREYGGIGVKRVSDVYRTTRLAFLVKMLNHDVLQFRNMARESLRLDMVKRGVPLSENSDNFLGYDLNANGFLNARTRFGCQSDWPDMLRYARKLGVKVIFRNGKAEITHNDLTLDETPKLQNRLFSHHHR